MNSELNVDFENNENDKLITFIIPTIGRLSILKTIESLKNLKINKWKCIIIFDGVENILQNLYNDERFLIIENEEKIGSFPNYAGEVRNLAFKYVDTEWIGFVDDDDTISPFYINNLLKEIELNNKIECCIFRMIYKNLNFLPKTNDTDIIKNNVGISFCFKSNLFKKIDNLYFINNSHEDYYFLEKIKLNYINIVISPFISYFIKSTYIFSIQHLNNLPRIYINNINDINNIFLEDSSDILIKDNNSNVNSNNTYNESIKNNKIIKKEIFKKLKEDIHKNKEYIEDNIIFNLTNREENKLNELKITHNNLHNKRNEIMNLIRLEKKKYLQNFQNQINIQKQIVEDLKNNNNLKININKDNICYNENININNDNDNDNDNDIDIVNDNDDFNDNYIDINNIIENNELNENLETQSIEDVEILEEDKEQYKNKVLLEEVQILEKKDKIIQINKNYEVNIKNELFFENIKNCRKIYIEFDGGLGNLLYQYFFIMNLSINNNRSIIFYNKNNNEKIRKNITKYRIFSGIKKNIKFDLTNNKNFIYYNEKSLNTDKQLNSFMKNNENKDIYFKGYFQSVFYLESNFDKIIDLLDLSFKTLSSEIMKRWKEENNFENKKIVGIHIRGTDYLKYPDIYNILDENYYKNALKNIYLLNNNDINNIELIIFTDDLKYVKNKFKFFKELKVHYINDILNKFEPYSKIEKYQDEIELFCLSSLNYQISANSTFSLWSSYFGNHEVVYIPSKWFEFKGPDVSIQQFLLKGKKYRLI